MKKMIIASMALLLSTGCASIVNGTNQPVSVETKAQGVAVTGASCKLSNDKGVWYVTTPGSVTVHRSFEAMSIVCDSKEYEPGLASVGSSTKGMAFGNIIFGGIIGAGIDIGSGAAYDYPSLFVVQLGKLIGLAGDKQAELTPKKAVPLPISSAPAFVTW
jgi:hypothetical protein